MAGAWPIAAPPLRTIVDEFPLGPRALLHLISVSSICATRLVQNPEILLWLRNPEVCALRRGPGRMLNELRVFAADAVAAENFRALRLWKGREMLRIALREVADVAPLEETTAELSQLAEICLAEVWKNWDAELRLRRGSPATEFAVLGLGKLGGRELNHSSDIDVVFIYGEEGQLSANVTHHEWFNRLGAKIVETFASGDSAGALFRIDLRLRPEGSAGPLARSLESMENYYAGFGETWERLALTKARGVCGSRELAYEFVRQHQPFVYPRSPTPDLLDEIAAIKRRIERDIVGPGDLERDVKLGTGGIREIEFVVQALQIIHGARHAFLQDTSTLKVLSALAQLDLLPRAEAVALDAAYHFLRRVEHRLQIEAEQQTHTLPADAEALERLARSLSFPGTAEFLEILRKHMRHVRSVFARVVSGTSDAAGSTADISIFRDEKSATKALADLAEGPASFHVSARTRQVSRKLRPLLLQWLAQMADPDATLNQFVRFVRGYGMRSLLFELLVVNPRLLELLVKTFDASRVAGDLLIRQPQLLEEITRGEALDQPLSTADHLRRLKARNLRPGDLDAVRSYRQNRLLRILLRDILELAPAETIFTELSALAEACLIFVGRSLGTENELTVIALGKFGGSEISYGADLDVLFIGENVRAAQKLMSAMAQPTAEGALATLDPRLRPDGEKGPVVAPIESYSAYYDGRAQLWEVQALTRARAIAGPLGPQFMELVQRVWCGAGKRPDLFDQVGAMAGRVRRERSSGSDFLDFKTGTGGMIEAEFLVQALQMQANIYNPRMTGALAQLTRAGLLAASAAQEIERSYAFLRRCESVLRRANHKSGSVLPAEPDEQRKLAIRLGLDSADALASRAIESRDAIHRVFTQYFSV
ncbi:MAG: bifunctional [glutamate--ammonia ligase]-adenylyl-L-tyrosine phosphorylase/[glutamate--ammonia-ligase] adenylyltransferase [Chthoniobacterales bacterium]